MSGEMAKRQHVTRDARVHMSQRVVMVMVYHVTRYVGDYMRQGMRRKATNSYAIR